MSTQSIIVEIGHTSVPSMLLDFKHVPHARIVPPISLNDLIAIYSFTRAFS